MGRPSSNEGVPPDESKPRSLSTQWKDVLLQDRVMSRNRDIGVSSAAAIYVEYQSDMSTITSNLTASRLDEILR